MFNPNLKIGAPFLVRNRTTAVSSTYVTGNVFSLDYHNAVALLIDYDKSGDETSMLIRVEVSNDNGATWFQETADSISGGTVTKSLAERSYSISGNYSELITPLRAGLVRVATRGNSTTAVSGSVHIEAIPLWV